MPSTIDYTTMAAGRLAARLVSGVTSGATITANEIEGTPITWPTGAHRVQVKRTTPNGTRFETVGVASASQSGGTVTLGTLTRQMSLTDGGTFTSGGNGYTFPANTDVYISWDVFDAERTMKDDKVNTITGAGAIRGSSTTVPIIRLNNVTTAQRTAMSAANGDMVYDTDLSAIFQYKGGAWVEVGDTGTAAATTTTLGTAEKGTTADIRAEAAVGDGGGPIFIPADATAILKDDRIVLKDATELTIASGAITVTQPYHNVDTQSDAASDDLDTINAAVGVGEIIVLVANNTARTVVVKHNTGNIKLADAADFSLDDTEKSITLLKQTSNWIEIARGRGAAAASEKVIMLQTPLLRPTGTNGCGAQIDATGSTGLRFGVLPFDAATEENAYGSFRLPDDYTGGTVKYRVHWYGGATGNVVWGATMTALNDGDGVNSVTEGTRVTVTDAGGVDLYRKTDQSSAVTIGNTPSAGDLVALEIARVAADGSDTMTGDAQLLGVEIDYSGT